MSTSEQIIKDALALPPEDRAEVVEQLLESFQAPPDPDLDKLWAREAEDRVECLRPRRGRRRFSRRGFCQNRATAGGMRITYLDAADSEFAEAIVFLQCTKAGIGLSVCGRGQSGDRTDQKLPSGLDARIAATEALSSQSLSR